MAAILSREWWVNDWYVHLEFLRWREVSGRRWQLIFWAAFWWVHCSKQLVLWVIIGSSNGLAPVRRQTITWINHDSLSIEPSGTNFNEILMEIQTFSLKNMRLKRPSVKNVDHLVSPSVCYAPFNSRVDSLVSHGPWFETIWRYFVDDTFTCIPFTEKCISIGTSPTFVLGGSIDDRS